MMRSKERDKAGGTLDRVRGRIREATGALSGSERQRVKGRARQDKGSARKKRGHLRDLLRK
ncbi:MAG TPA: CsbD family protein [Solirubrobacterales bacterium]|nr:CsbD family protein [Solirubrobacterales bacterium]